MWPYCTISGFRVLCTHTHTHTLVGLSYLLGNKNCDLSLTCLLTETEIFQFKQHLLRFSNVPGILLNPRETKIKLFLPLAAPQNKILTE